MKNTDKNGKPVPRVEKYIDKDGRSVSREYHLVSDVPFPTKEEFEKTHNKVLLKLTPKRDLEALEKHFKGSKKPTKNKKVVADFPDLPDCFNKKGDFERYFNILQIRDLYDIYEDGTYKLKNNKKVYLSCVAHRLLEKGKLINSIKSSQDLARGFCPYFHVGFNPKNEKQFQPDRINRIKKDSGFITFINNTIK